MGTKKSVRYCQMSVKSVRNRGVLITELKKVTDRGFVWVCNCRLSVPKISEIRARPPPSLAKLGRSNLV